MSATSLSVELPEGIPHYSLMHGYYLWPKEKSSHVLVHHDWDLLWIDQGSAHWAFQDGRSVTAHEGQFAVLPPLLPMVMRPLLRPLGYWYCHFNFRLAPGMHSRETKEAMVGAARGVRVPLVFNKTRAAGLVRAFGSLNRLDRNGPLFAWRIECATLRLISELVAFALVDIKKAAHATILRPSLTSNARISAICDMIQKEPARNWRVAELAKSVGLSRSRLHHLSKLSLGKSLKEFLIENRMELALRLLKETRNGNPLSVKEVSVACGFSSQHLLSRQFKGRFQISPRSYQQGTMVA